MDDLISRQAVLKLLSTMPPEEAITKAMLIQSVKQMDAPDNLVKDSQGLAKDLVNDCISRQAAIDALHMHLMYRMGTDSNKKRLDEWINNLPSAQPEQRWIPCSERLPENGYWLWSAKGGEVQKDFYWDGHWEIAEKYGYDVMAWMPLPEPYREEEQDG